MVGTDETSELGVYSFGVVYIGGAIASLIWLRYMSPYIAHEKDSAILIYILFAVVWAGDIGGYIFGKLLGRHKIAPKISPGKTWEGFIGGIISTSALFIICIVRSTDFDFVFLPGLILGIAFTTVGLAGDLFESHLKRSAGVKDSGNLIPGHGGLFDRVDALIPSSFLFIPVALLIGMIAYGGA
jgi:phosphatidate cytidylyltransferase